MENGCDGDKRKRGNPSKQLPTLSIELVLEIVLYFRIVDLPAALLTGKWVHKIGFQDLEVEYYSNFSVPLRHTLLPQRLRVAAGYRTYGIGKWNIGHCNAQYLPFGLAVAVSSTDELR